MKTDPSEVTSGPSSNSRREKKRSGVGAGSWEYSSLFLPFVLQPSSPTAAADATQSPQIFTNRQGLFQVSQFIVKLPYGSSVENPGACPGFPGVPVVLGGSSNQKLARFYSIQRENKFGSICIPGISGAGCRGRRRSTSSRPRAGAWARGRRGAGMRGADPAAPGAPSRSGFGTLLGRGFHSNLHLHLACGHRCNSARSRAEPGASAGVRGGRAAAAAGAGEGPRGAGAGPARGRGGVRAPRRGGGAAPRGPRRRGAGPRPAAPRPAAWGTPERASGKGKCTPRSRPFRTLLGASFHVDSVRRASFRSWLFWSLLLEITRSKISRRDAWELPTVHLARNRQGSNCRDVYWTEPL